jgi:hypothetical protein
MSIDASVTGPTEVPKDRGTPHQELAIYKCVVEFSDEERRESLENTLWETKLEWVDEILERLKTKHLTPDYEDIVYAKRVGLERKSIEVTIALVLAGGQTLLDMTMTKYPDLFERLKNLSKDIVSTVKVVIYEKLPRGPDGGKPHFKVDVWSFPRADLDREVTTGGFAFPPWAVGVAGLLIGAGLVVLAVWLMPFLLDRDEASQASQPAAGGALRIVKSYDFESAPVQHLGLVENTTDFSLADPGFMSRNSLQLELSLMPFDESAGKGQGGFRCDLREPDQIRAVSARVLLPSHEQLTSDPFLVELVFENTDGKSEHSTATELQVGKWTPLFWISPFDPGEEVDINSIEMWVYRQREPYSGPIFIDNLRFFELPPEEADYLVTEPSQ